MKERIKINGIVIIISIVVIVFFSRLLIRKESFFLSDVLEVIGVSLIFLGQLLRVSARGHKSENSKSGKKLIQDGPYALVRNPMYLGIILIGLGVVLFILEFWAFVLFVLLFAFRYWELFVKEEKMLSEAFGEQYSDYKKNVPRIIPKLSFICREDIRSYFLLKMSWFKRESLSIALVLAVCLLIEFREELTLQGQKALLPEVLMFLVVGGGYFIFILFLVKRDAKKTR
ncbi:MAG: isoprenylcysteine carboxylmethyltransferase family protein [Candidatus Omnitrophota bacterium]